MKPSEEQSRIVAEEMSRIKEELIFDLMAYGAVGIKYEDGKTPEHMTLDEIKNLQTHK